MEEIGGYIEFEYNHGAMLHENSNHLNCARRAFSYLIKSRNIRKVWLPILSCDSVIEPFKSSNCEINFYSVDSQLFPLINSIPSNEWIVIINYYGQIDNRILSGIKEKYSHIIFDNTQAYFQSPLKDVDTIYSCRKFFGVSDGAFLYTNSVIEDNLEVDESYKRMTYLIGRFERSASEFYSLFDKNNSIFDAEPIKKEEQTFKADEDEDINLLVDLSEDEKPSVKEVTMGDALEYFHDLGLEYNVDYVDATKDRVTGRRVRENYEDSQEFSEKEDTRLSRLSNDKVEVPVKEEKEVELDSDDNLFDLIDSMYKEND